MVSIQISTTSIFNMIEGRSGFIQLWSSMAFFHVPALMQKWHALGVYMAATRFLDMGTTSMSIGPLGKRGPCTTVEELASHIEGSSSKQQDGILLVKHLPSLPGSPPVFLGCLGRSYLVFFTAILFKCIDQVYSALGPEMRCLEGRVCRCSLVPRTIPAF